MPEQNEDDIFVQEFNRWKQDEVTQKFYNALREERESFNNDLINLFLTNHSAENKLMMMGAYASSIKIIDKILSVTASELNFFKSKNEKI